MINFLITLSISIIRKNEQGISFSKQQNLEHATIFETSSIPFLRGRHKCMVPNIFN